MDVSVVIVSYNVSSFLDQALITLARAIGGLEAEVFVVDNDSADDSVAMVRDRHPWVNLIESGGNIGFARANNLALAHALGRYVLLLNPDTVVRPDTLSTMVRFLDTHPESGAAGCKVLNPDGTLQLACRRGFPTPGAAFYKLIGLSGLFPRSRTFGAYNLTYLDPDETAEVDALSGSFMMIRREALDQVGFLDEDFFMYGEDLDLCYRIKNAGWKINYVPDTEIIHFKGESTRTVPTHKSIRDFYIAMRIFVDKHHGMGSRRIMPQWLMVSGIYASMAAVYSLRLLKKNWQPLLDLALLNTAMVMGILLRFGVLLEQAPAYSGLQWASVFVVYSVLYMGTMYFLGVYNRHRYDPARVLLGVFIGFVLNVFIVNFFEEYNFSRIASIYCWGFNSILLSGWRFIWQLSEVKRHGSAISRAVVAGAVCDAVVVRDRIAGSSLHQYDIIGCVETTPGAIRGTVEDGLHVLGLVDDIPGIINEYGIDTVIMVGTGMPFARILHADGRFGVSRPDFKLVPELPPAHGVESEEDMAEIAMFSIRPGGTISSDGN
jgi:O-antigen biosynthesis protein